VRCAGLEVRERAESFPGAMSVSNQKRAPETSPRNLPSYGHEAVHGP
jgi:hypothetical protein